MPTRPNAIKSVLPSTFAILLVAVVAAGCGSSDDDSTDPVGKTTLCRQITQQRELAERPTERPTGESFRVSLESIKDNPGQAKLTPISLSLLQNLPAENRNERFGAQDGVFAIVVYRIENTGPNAFKPEDTFEEMFGIQVGENKIRTYLRADRDERCGQVAALFAERNGLDSPKIPVEPGASVKTVAIYGIPENASEIVWTAANTGDRVPLP